MFSLILLVFAFVLSVIAAWHSPQPAPQPMPYFPRLIAAALACYFLACILSNQVIATHLGNLPR